MSTTLPADREAAFWSGVAETGRFFMGEADVHRALARIVAALEDRQIPYALVGALALNEWGYRRATVDVDLLLSETDLAELKRASGLSAPHRLRDLADVLELIRALALPRDFASCLDPSVAAKFDELWQAAQGE